MTTRRAPARRTVRRSGRRIRYLWQSVTFGETSVAPNVLLPLQAGGALDADVKSGSTLVRMLGIINVVPNDDVAVNLRVTQWSAGAMVTNDDLAASAVTFPDPQFDNADWFWFTYGVLGYTSRSASDGVIFGINTLIDTKSKRVLRGEQKEITWVFKNHPTSQDSVTVSISCRLLFRLS